MTFQLEQVIAPIGTDMYKSLSILVKMTKIHCENIFRHSADTSFHFSNVANYNIMHNKNFSENFLANYWWFVKFAKVFTAKVFLQKVIGS